MHDFDSADHVLGIFAKRPLPGLVKTRLAAETSPEWAAQVAEAFLFDILDRFTALHARQILLFSPDSEQAYFEKITAGRYRVVPQTEGDLGQRMERFIREQLESPTTAVVLLGADSPSLPIELIEDAFDQLTKADVVLGPATDGGYYLIGCARLIPNLFSAIDWSTPRVLAQTVEHVAAAKASLAVLSPWYDVDTLADWHFLAGHLRAMEQSGVPVPLPRIQALIAQGAPELRLGAFCPPR